MNSCKCLEMLARPYLIKWNLIILLIMLFHIYRAYDLNLQNTQQDITCARRIKKFLQCTWQIQALLPLLYVNIKYTEI